MSVIMCAIQTRAEWPNGAEWYKQERVARELRMSCVLRVLWMWMCVCCAQPHSTRSVQQQRSETGATRSDQ